MPIKKLICLKCPYTSEETEIVHANFGLNAEILRHMRIDHRIENPKEGRDYKVEDVGLL